MEYIKIMSYFVGWPQIIELSKNLYSFSAKLNKLLDYIKNTELYSFLNDKLRSFQIFVCSSFKQNIWARKGKCWLSDISVAFGVFRFSFSLGFGNNIQ